MIFFITSLSNFNILPGLNVINALAFCNLSLARILLFSFMLKIVFYYFCLFRSNHFPNKYMDSVFNGGER
jgi:hypothetical protein